MLASTVYAEERDTTVRGHYRDTNKDGVKDTWVNPYHRTRPNDTTLDNYGVRGNTNPWTQERGTENPYQKQRR